MVAHSGVTMADDISGKTALVTGSAQGIGKVIAMELAKLGVHVLVNCAHSKEKAEAVVRQIVEQGGNAEMLICNIADEKELAEIAKQAQPVLPQSATMSGRLVSLRQNATSSATHALCNVNGQQLVPVCFLKSPRMDLRQWENRDV